jgi:hypothetical protein
MDQFEKGSALDCSMCQAMCPEAVDGTLTAAEQATFDRHVAGCVECSQELDEAHRGAAWMQMLKGSAPEPPAALLQKILAETSGAELYTPAVIEVAEYLPMPKAEKQSWWSGFSATLSTTFSMRSMSMSPRIAMTAAMAFFSLALTMNMLGVHVSDIRLSSLRPSSIRRSVADASSSGIRSFQNLRVVYEFESRMDDMRNDGALGERFEDQRPSSGTPFTGSQKDDQQQQQQQQNPQPQGKSALEMPKLRSEVVEKGA